MRYVLLVLMMFCASICIAAPGDVLFASFESDSDTPFTGAGTQVTRAEKNASEGKYSLMLPIVGSTKDSWPGLSLTSSTGLDWSSYQVMKLDVFVEGDSPVTLGMRIDSKGSTGWLYGLPVLQPGWNRNWVVPINDVRETTDLHKITAIWLGASAPRKSANVYFDNIRLGPFDFGFKRILHLDPTPGLTPNRTEIREGFILFGVPYGTFVFPHTKPKVRLGAIQKFAAQGEKEAVVLNINALRDLQNVQVKVSALQGPNNTRILPENWDVRIVRHKDKRENYQIDSYVVDIPTYLAVPKAAENINKQNSASFWLTLTAPANALPGVYKGTINVSTGSIARNVPVSVRILPFKLPELTGEFHGVYYRPFGKGMDTREKITFDLADMKAHGMTSLGLCIGVDSSSYKVTGDTVSFDFKGNTAFEYIMDAYRDLGYKEPIVMLADSGQDAAKAHPYASEAYARTYTNFWKGMDQVIKSKGWKPFYIQPEDEVGWRTAADRERNTYLLGLLKKAGLMTEVDGPSDTYFNKEAGPLSDIWNYNGIIGPPDIVASAIKEGKIVTVYNFDSSGFTPEVQRWARGLFNWKHGLRGSFNWEYRGGNGSIFDDQDAQLGDWVHYYPDFEGNSGGPSTGWEGSREGLDDRRYIRLLETLIASAKSKGGKAAIEAGKVSSALMKIKQQLTDHPDSTANRVAWGEKLAPAEAVQKGYIAAVDPNITWYYTGDIKLPNGQLLESYDNIRWFAANESIKLMNLIAQKNPPAASNPKVPAVKKRLIGVQRLQSSSSNVQARRPTAAMPLLKTAPKLDGDVSDAVWKDAARVDLNLSNGTGKPLGPTDVYFGVNQSVLYVAFVCSEDRPNDIVAKIRDKNGPVWEDDCVEVFIDPNRNNTTYYQVLANSLGTTNQIGPAGTEWKADIRAAGSVDVKNRKWICEIAIPLEGMKLAPTIGLNFARERRPLNILELSSWAVTGGSFGKPELFGIVTMSGKMPGIKIETVKPQLTMKLLPPVITAGTKSLKIALDTAYDPEHLSKASTRISINGNGKKHDIYIPGPIAEHMIATIDISDLAPGYYNISGAVVLSSRKLASWQGTLPVMPAY